MSRLRITQLKSAASRARGQAETLRALGLKHLYDTVEHEASPSITGMVRKVSHLVEVEELKSKRASSKKEEKSK